MKLGITKKDLFWYLLSENYEGLCWKMIADIKVQRLSHKKVEAYLDIIMEHVPDAPALEMVTTFVRTFPALEPTRLKNFEVWHEHYGPMIINRPRINGYKRT